MAVIFGTALHKLCEGVKDDLHDYEVPLQEVFTVDGVDYILNGTLDEVELAGEIETVVTDNKTCLLHNIGYPKPEYNLQLNIYAHMLRKSFQPDSDYTLRIRYFIKDWTSGALQKELDRYPDDFAVWLEGNKTATKSCRTMEEAVRFIPTLSAKSQARASIKPRDRSAKRAEIMRSIPDSPIHIVDVPVMEPAKIEEYIKARIKFHVENPDAICMESERWGGDVRCRHYCDVVSVCPHAEKMGYCK
jgi:hypothetical protein